MQRFIVVNFFNRKYPSAQIHRGRGRKRAFIEEWDSVGRLGIVCTSEICVDAPSCRSSRPGVLQVDPRTHVIREHFQIQRFPHVEPSQQLQTKKHDRSHLRCTAKYVTTLRNDYDQTVPPRYSNNSRRITSLAKRLLQMSGRSLLPIREHHRPM